MAVVPPVQLLVPGWLALGGDRRIHVGADMPLFSAVDLEGRRFEYAHGAGRPVVIVFLSAGHEKSQKAAADIRKIVKRVSEKTDAFDAVMVITYERTGSPPGAGGDPNRPPATVFDRYAAEGFTVLPDTEYRIWGMFGIIATPTVVISDAGDKVLWVEAGYGYDFVPMVEVRLNQALGLADASEAAQAARVRTVANDTVSARAKRHLHMAELLRKKGRTKSALREIGWTYCQTGNPAAAIKVVGAVKGANRLETSKLQLVLGWAYRACGDLEEAEKHLLEALANDPRLGRAHFELGRIYQARKEFEKAADAYFKELSMIYSDNERPGR